jgi:class 3 adenylate cyclase
MSGGHQVAFQVIGDGPVDVLVGRPPLFPVDLMWDEPRLAHFLNRLSSFSRHIWFDARGTGASERIGHTEGRLAETVVEDMVTVVNEVGCERVVLLQLGGTALTLLFAATHPERTAALVAVNTSARIRWADDYPQGLSDDEVDRHAAYPAYGSVEGAAPSLVNDVRFRRWFDRAARLSCPPHDHLWRNRSALDTDLRATLGSVQAPTLVVSRRDILVAAQCRYLADHIAQAKWVELDGGDPLAWVGDAGAVLDAIEEFLTGHLPSPQADRVLATVLFTDIVDSTPQAARMGDRRWRELLATHDALISEELDRFRGAQIKSTGDGVLATFDGPARAIRCACAIRDALQSLGVEMRVGLHTGEIELRGDDIAGIAVHIAQRVQGLAQPGEVLVSRTVADLLAGSDIDFHDRGEHELKGLPRTWRLFSVSD